MIDVMDFFKSWLADHIMKIDQRLGKWIASLPKA